MVKHRKSEVPPLPEALIENGNLIDKLAQDVFPEGKSVDSFGVPAAAVTKAMMEDNPPELFQATAYTDDMLAKADILLRDGEGWELIEVKASNKVKPEHYADVAFQVNLFRKAGFNITAASVMHLNSDYRRRGDIHLKALFKRQNVDRKLAKLLPEIPESIDEARSVVIEAAECPTCTCYRLYKDKRCVTFSLFHPELPEYPVWDIPKIAEEALEELMQQGVTNVHDIPDGFEVADPAGATIALVKGRNIQADVPQIKSILDSFQYPIYFLDYETAMASVPIYENTFPYQQVPFQYSLHVLPEPGAKLEHHEYLATNVTKNPVRELSESLAKVLGAKGTVLVWHKSFEMKRNEEMAEMESGFASFYESINERVYDLKEIFSKGHYRHHGFPFSNSIKAVLPVLVPELSYKDLDIQQGDDASEQWRKALDDEFDDEKRVTLYEGLRKYCALDTLAMVRIYEHLRKICNAG